MTNYRCRFRGVIAAALSALTATTLLVTIPATASATAVNFARTATATASSEYTAYQQTAAKAIDGVVSGYPDGDYTKEWATAGQRSGWLQLNWPSAVKVNKIVLYDRVNLTDQVTGGKLTFADGSTVTVPSLNNSGGAVTVNFTARSTTSVRFTVTSVSASTGPVGLAELEVWGDGVTNPPAAPPNPPAPATPWRNVFSENFTDTATTWPGSYSNNWDSYDGFPDTSGSGEYSNSIVSVHDGALDMFLHTVNGQALVAAPAPIISTSAWIGQLYGRYTVRFKADAVAGYKTAWLLWPDSGNWNDGEIDFPEADLTDTISAFSHCLGNPSKNCFWGGSNVVMGDGNWHTAVTEWTPGQLKFSLDGVSLGTTTTSPTTKMHMVLQTETVDGTPNASAAGHVYVDSVSIDAYSRS